MWYAGKPGVPVSGHAAVTLSDGSMFVYGGQGTSDFLQDTWIFSYDVPNGTN